MSSNIVDFQSEVDKRRVPDDIEKTSDNQYVLELEHEILELQQQVCALHRDLERERGRGTSIMRRVFLIAGLLAVTLTQSSAVHAAERADIDPRLIVSTLGVKTDHLKIRGSVASPDISYELTRCGSYHPSDASAEFKSNLVKLLPVLLARYPEMKIPRIQGGCLMTDGEFDDAAISAMFTREALDKVDWKHVTPDELFDYVSFGRFEIPAFRR